MWVVEARNGGGWGGLEWTGIPDGARGRVERRTPYAGAEHAVVVGPVHAVEAAERNDDGATELVAAAAGIGAGEGADDDAQNAYMHLVAEVERVSDHTSDPASSG